MYVAETEQIHFVRFRCLAVDRVTEEQEYIDLVAGDACCDLLVAALRTAQLPLDPHAYHLCHLLAGRSRCT